MSEVVLIIDPNAVVYGKALQQRFPALKIRTATAGAAASAYRDVTVIIANARSVTLDLIRAAPGLRWIQTLTSGVDPLPALLGSHRQVMLTSARGIHGPQMSELAFLLMLALTRRLPLMLANQQARQWQPAPPPLLAGKTAVILGLGAVGRALALRCRAFDIRVIAVSALMGPVAGVERILPRSELLRAAGMADFLIVLTPLEARTRHLVGTRVFEAMKPTAFLINLSRGSVVDEAALAIALTTDRIAGAGVDVFEHEPLPADSPLWGAPNTIVSPHIGGRSDCYTEQVLPVLLENVHCYLSGRIQDMKNAVLVG